MRPWKCALIDPLKNENKTFWVLILFYGFKFKFSNRILKASTLFGAKLLGQEGLKFVDSRL
jgi:hypothetical protein